MKTSLAKLSVAEYVTISTIPQKWLLCLVDTPKKLCSFFFFLPENATQILVSKGAKGPKGELYYLVKPRWYLCECLGTPQKRSL